MGWSHLETHIMYILLALINLYRHHIYVSLQYILMYCIPLCCSVNLLIPVPERQQADVCEFKVMIFRAVEGLTNRTVTLRGKMCQ